MQGLERWTRVGSVLSSVVLAIAGGAVAAHFSLLPASIPAYAWVSATLMPLAAALMLLASPLLLPRDPSATTGASGDTTASGFTAARQGTPQQAADARSAAQSGALQLRSTALPAFALATAGTIAGTFVAWAAVGSWLPGHSGAAVASALCASYVGGTLNLAAVIEVRLLPKASTCCSEPA
jgi:uncharacterized membrane protein